MEDTHIHALFLQCAPSPEDNIPEFQVLRTFGRIEQEFKTKVQETLDTIFQEQDLIVVCPRRELYTLIQDAALSHRRNVKIITDPRYYRESFRNAELCLCYNRAYDFSSKEWIDI